MRITRFHFGEHISLSPTKSGDLLYWYGNRYRHLGDPARAVPKDVLFETRSDPQRGPFERVDFGDRDRLAWACGACAMQLEVPYVCWGERYAMWFEGSQLCTVDATRALLVRLGLPISLDPLKSVLFHGGTAYIHSARDLMLIALGEIEGLFERASGSLDVHVREHYPHHRPTAKAKMFVQYILEGRASLVDRDGDHGWLYIPFVPGLEEGAPVTLHDELMKGHYREIEVPGYPRVTLHAMAPSELDEVCQLVVAPAIDPAGPLVKASTAARADDLERVFRQLADDPDDDAARIVVVDLLEDAGEPYAAHFAKLLAGDTSAATQRDALGTLANYFHELEWRGNLPWVGTLSTSAPNDEDIGDLVAADYRLGFFRALRLGEGNFRLYSKLVASSRAVGLRHVDGSRAAILQALIGARRRDLRRLTGVKFATREVHEALADSTFDGVVEIETEVQASVVGRVLDFIARDELKFFARAPRHLILQERVGDVDELVQPVLAAWPRLPLDKLTMGGITIARDGTAHAAEDASDVIRTRVAANFRFG